MRTPLFFISRFAVSLADQFLLFVVPIMVYQTTQSIAWSSLSFAIETIPRVCYTPFAGAISDKYSPFKVVKNMMNIRCLLCVFSIGLALIVENDYMLFIIIGLSTLVGVASVQSFLSSEVLLPISFTDVPFAKVQSWTQSVDQSAIVIGPIFAAVVLEIYSWESVILIASSLFFIGQISFSFWLKRIQPTQCNDLVKNDKNVTLLADFKTALSLVKNNKTLLMVIGQTALVNLLFGSTMATAAAMVSGKFNLSPTSFGVLQMSGAVASIIILTITALTLNRLTITNIGRLSFLMICMGGILYSSSASYVLFFLGFMIVLGFDGMFNVYIRTIRQKIIPAQDYGKATGVIVFLNNITKPLSGLIIGAFGFIASIESIILTMVVVVSVVGAALFRKLNY